MDAPVSVSLLGQFSVLWHGFLRWGLPLFPVLPITADLAASDKRNLLSYRFQARRPRQEPRCHLGCVPRDSRAGSVPVSSSFRWLLAFLSCDHNAPVSAFRVTLPPPLRFVSNVPYRIQLSPPTR